jgi:hypothetical protein
LLIASDLKKRFNLVKSEKEFFSKKIRDQNRSSDAIAILNDLILCLLIGIEASGRKKKV